MARLKATMVVDLVDRTGAKTQSVIGNMSRLRRAERDLYLAQSGARLSPRDRAMERLMIEQQRLSDERRARFAAFGRTAGLAAVAAGYGAAKAYKEFADTERTVNRIVLNADKGAEAIAPTMKMLQDIAKATRLSFEDVTSGLETLVASGRSLEESLSFLPAVALTAQASGADISDIALSADALSGSLKISSAEMQHAFDLLVAGGKAGKFELKDMAQYLPSLLPAFAAMGYEGSEGLQKIVAMLQIVRNQAGSSAEAATYLGNVVNKMYSEETAGKFKKFGINITKALDKAKKEGRDVLEVFLDMATIATKGDLSKLPRLFTDAEYQKGIRALITQRQETEALVEALNNVDGTALKDFGQIAEDSAAQLQQLANNWDRLVQNIGKGVATVANPVLEAINNDIDLMSARAAGAKKRNDPWYHFYSDNEMNYELPYEGGYRDAEFLKRYKDRIIRGEIEDKFGLIPKGGQKGSLLPHPNMSPLGVTDRLAPGEMPVPRARPQLTTVSDDSSKMRRAYSEAGRSMAEAPWSPVSRGLDQNILADSISKLDAALAGGGEKIAGSGRIAAKDMESSAATIGRAIGAAAGRAFNETARVPGAGRSTGRVLQSEMDGQFVDH